MADYLKNLILRIKNYFAVKGSSDISLRKFYNKYREYTMIPEPVFLSNLKLISNCNIEKGSIVECGVWRGGMIAAVSELLGSNNTYYLFDSFEGLPEAKEIDGQAAKSWQENKDSDWYYNNCKAEISYAENAMKLSGVRNFEIIKGWFSETLTGYSFKDEITLLRLDGDWYDSTIECLTSLFPKVKKGGIIIIDDYYAWDGCSRAVHDYLSQNKRPERIFQFNDMICYIIKK